MTKESPFKKSFMKTIEKLRMHGIIDHIWRNYLPVIDEEKCKEPKVSNSYLENSIICILI